MLSNSLFVKTGTEPACEAFNLLELSCPDNPLTIQVSLSSFSSIPGGCCSAGLSPSRIILTDKSIAFRV